MLLSNEQNVHTQRLDPHGVEPPALHQVLPACGAALDDARDTSTAPPVTPPGG